MKKIVFATNNQGKVREAKAVFSGLNFEVFSLKDIGLNIDVVEDGMTFEENAEKKAVEVMRVCNQICMADDSGLEIDYLDKRPGVYSARFLGEATPYEVKNKRILEMLKDVPEDKRTARFISVIALAFPDGSVKITKGIIEGIIGYEERGENGFGYDPIFYLPSLLKTTGEISLEEKNKISHRGKALSDMKKILEVMERDGLL